MKYTSNFKLKESYWNEFFYQSYLYGGIKGKIVLSLAVIALIVGVGMLFTPIPIYASIILIVIGMFESVGLPLKFRMWKFRNGVKTKYDDEMSFTFKDDDLYYRGKTNEGKSQWSGIVRWAETPKGFLLWPQRNIQFYIPKSSMNTETESFLREKCLTNRSN